MSCASPCPPSSLVHRLVLGPRHVFDAMGEVEDLNAVRRFYCLLLYFLRTALCGLSLPMRPLSVPAAGSITALMRVGLPESMAASTARLSSSGVVARAPKPPKASAMLL